MALFQQHSSGAKLGNTATFVGDIAVSAGVNVWFGAVVRGDVARITLGENVNIQDNAVVHCDFDVPQILEAGVVVGHNAIVHGERIGQDTLIGMGAIILSGVQIGAESVVAAGAVVSPNKVYPPRSLLMGIPAKVVRQVTDEEVERTRATNRRYAQLSHEYLAGQHDASAV